MSAVVAVAGLARLGRVPDAVHPATLRVRDAAARAGVTIEIATFDASTHTAEDAARAIGAELGQIVKSLVFVAPDANGDGAVGGLAAVIALVSGTDRVDIAKLGVVPLSARINFTDEDGPKGGVAIRCAITVPVPRRAAVHVEHVAPARGIAFDGALDTLEQRLAQRRRREREAGRRPKKYYVAKRALTGELPGGGRTGGRTE